MVKPDPAIFEDQDAALEVAADADGLADLDAGRTLDHDAMKAWLLSWGTAAESPPPRKRD